MTVLNPQPLYPQLRRLNLQTINACPPLDSLFILIILVRIAPSQRITHSLLHHFTPSEQITPSELHPPWQANSYNILPPLKNLAQKDVRDLSCIFLKNPNIAAPLLHHFTPLGRPTLTSFYPLKLTLFQRPHLKNGSLEPTTSAPSVASP